MESTAEGLMPADRYGEIAAHVAHFKGTREAEIVERLGASPADYKASQRHWVSLVGDELERDETALATTIGEAFARSRAKLAETNPPVESLGPLKTTAEEAPSPPPAPPAAPPKAPEIQAPEVPSEHAVVAPPAAPHAAEVPSFLRADMPRPLYRPVEVASVAATAAATITAATTATATATATAPPLAGAPSFVATPPLAATPPLVQPPPQAPPLRMPPAVMGIGGTAIGEDIQKIARSILPFGPQKQGAPAPPAATPAPSPPRAQEPKPQSGQTTMGVDLTAAIKGALPFPAGASPASPGPSAGASPQAGSAPVAPALTLEQYASLCVDLQNPQADAAAVLRRYSLTPETKRALDSRFSELFHRDPAQNAAFQQACVAYRAWLARGAAPRKT